MERIDFSPVRTPLVQQANADAAANKSVNIPYPIQPENNSPPITQTVIILPSICEISAVVLGSIVDYTKIQNSYIQPSFKRYEGQTLGLDTPHGYGTMHYHDGSTYVGFWNEGHRHGQGTMTYGPKTLLESIQWVDEKSRWAGELSGYYDTEAGETAIAFMPNGIGADHPFDERAPMYYFNQQPLKYSGQWLNGHYFDEQGTGEYPNGKTFVQYFNMFWLPKN